MDLNEIRNKITDLLYNTTAPQGEVWKAIHEIEDQYKAEIEMLTEDVHVAVDDVIAGKDASRDEFIETLIAADMSKDPYLAEAYKSGSVYRFSMGCDVTDTECSICEKVATNTLQFCEHVRGKHSRRAYPLKGGGQRKASEWCRGTIFAELSAVDDPADKDAEIQEGLLRIASNDLSLTERDLCEISSFVARHANQIPEALAGLINSVLPRS